MQFFQRKRLQAGIEILPDAIRSAVIVKKGKREAIRQLSDVKLLSGTLKPSFKKENIIQMDAFGDSLKKVCKEISIKPAAVGLPDSCAKVLVKTYRELPKERTDIHDMIVWDIAAALKLPAEELRVSWNYMGNHPDGIHVLLVVISLTSIIAQYESVFKKLGVTPVQMAPSGICQFNFYCGMLPETGNIAYLGLFDDFINLFVFSNNVPIFYKMTRKGVMNNRQASAINDVDLLIQYFNSEYPDLKLDACFIASSIKSETRLEKILQDVSQTPLTLMDEKEIIGFHKQFKLNVDNEPLPFYTGVLGAARAV